MSERGEPRKPARDLLARIAEAHALPPIVAEIRRAMGDPDSTAGDIARIVCRDPAIAARMLALVNSAAFGFRRKIESIPMAVVILGFRRIHDLALTITLLARFGPRWDDPIDVREFWRHAIASALFAEDIARLHAPRARDGAFAAGLLHDLGKIVAAQEVPHLVREVSVRMAAGDPPLEAERAGIGIEHPEIAAFLGEAWGFPPTLLEAFRTHHAPGPDPGPVAAIAHVSDVLVRGIGTGVLPEDRVPRMDGGAAEALRLDAAWLDRSIPMLDRAVDGAEEFLRLLPTPPASARRHVAAPRSRR